MKFYVRPLRQARSPRSWWRCRPSPRWPRRHAARQHAAGTVPGGANPVALSHQHQRRDDHPDQRRRRLGPAGRRERLLLARHLARRDRGLGRLERAHDVLGRGPAAREAAGAGAGLERAASG